MFVIEDELKKLPNQPGVYLMHDSHDTVIYVGKAKILKNRVRQYFQDPARLSPKIRKMVSKIAWFEYIVVDSEMEALVLECNLIKQYSPKYNTMLKDDKMYPYIKVTLGEDFPRVFLTRKMLRDKAKYFGPYTNVTAARQTMELIRKLYKVRNCSAKLTEGDLSVRACLYSHIGQCDAPCQGRVSKEDYNAMIHEVMRFLNGDTDAILKDLETKMKDAAAEMDFENAAVYRDKINAIREVTQEQKATDLSADERDVIACAVDEGRAVVQVFFMRGGKMIGREHYFLKEPESTVKSYILGSFIKQFYSGTAYTPAEILCETEPEDADLIRQWLTKKSGRKVDLRIPKKGIKEKMIELAEENARIVLKNDLDKLTREAGRTVMAAEEISEWLGLSGVERMESYDISNISGFLNVGSMVVCENGHLKKNDYRKFRIKSVKGPDDYASMKEMLTRRFTHTLNELEENGESDFGRLPDLILMDGGRGQVNIAVEVLAELQLDIPVCGMVKDDRHRTRGLYYNNVEIPIDTHSEGFKLLTRIQDEVHRFAITFHRSLRGKEQVHSVLDDIKGVGPARRKMLMSRFKSIEEISNLSVSEIADLPGMNETVAESIYNYFH